MFRKRAVLLPLKGIQTKVHGIVSAYEKYSKIFCLETVEVESIASSQ